MASGEGSRLSGPSDNYPRRRILCLGVCDYMSSFAMNTTTPCAAVPSPLARLMYHGGADPAIRPCTFPPPLLQSWMNATY